MNEVGEPTNTQHIALFFTVKVSTNVRDDYLKRMVGDVVSDHLQGVFKSFTASGSKDDPKRFVHFVGMIGPTVSLFQRGTITGYERIDDPYDMESSGRYEEPPRQPRPIE